MLLYNFKFFIEIQLKNWHCYMLSKCPLISWVCKNSIKSELSKSVCVQIFMRLDDLLVPQSELLLDFEMAAEYLGILW